MHIISAILSAVENSRTRFSACAATFTALIATRMVVEGWVEGFTRHTAAFYFYEFAHFFLFFLLTYLLVLFILHRIAGFSVAQGAALLLFGFLLIIVPPLIDAVISGGRGFWSFYIFDGVNGLAQRYVTFFGKDPTFGITYGTRIEVALATILLIFVTYAKTRRVGHALVVGILAYTLFFVLGTFPSWITLLTIGWSHGFLAITQNDIAQLFLSPGKFFAHSMTDIESVLNRKMSVIYAPLLLGVSGYLLRHVWREKFLAFVHNTRMPQIIYHSGLLVGGIAAGTFFSYGAWSVNLFTLLAFVTMLCAITFAWVASVIANDLFDQKIDRITNPTRPLTRGVFTTEEYGMIGWGALGLSLFLAMVVNGTAGFLLLGYHALTWLYNAPPLRLKRFPLVATFIAAVASFLIVMIGVVLVSPSENGVQFPFALGAFLVGVFTVVLPLKDFKDIPGDRADGVYTLPVLLGERWSRILIGGGTFLAYLLSVAIFHAPALWWWAVACGGLSFWMIIMSTRSRWITPHTIFWWVLVVVTLYVARIAALLSFGL